MGEIHHMPIAELRSASKSYGNVRALSGLDLSITPGEVLAVLGPNGAGKTTTVKLLLGLIRPDTGSVKVFGYLPTDREARIRVGAMLQISQVPETLKVREHIELFRCYYPKPLATDELIRIAGLEEVADRLSGKISGGQMQRLMFALAICGDPELLFLDEPTVGLDVASRRSFWKAIREFIARGKSIVLTTHYLEEADALADRIVVIDHGKTVAEGSPQSIKERFARRQIRCHTRLNDDELGSLPGVGGIEREGSQVILMSDLPEETLRGLLNLDPEVSDLEVKGVGLEEAFLHLTGNENMEDAA